MKLPHIPPPYVGWALCLGMACALALSCYAIRDIRAAASEKRVYRQLTDSMRVLLRGDWRKIGPYDRVYYGRPPTDTLRITR